MIESTEFIKKSLELLGRSLRLNKRIKKRYIFFILLSIFLIIESFLTIIMEWSDIKSRYLAIEDFVMTSYVTLLFIDFAIMPKKTINIIDKIQRKTFLINYKLNDKQNEKIKSSKKMMKKFVKICAVATYLYNFSTCIVPFITSIIIINNKKFQTDNNNNNNLNMIKNLPLAFECWLSKKINSLYFYYLIVLLQTIYGVVEGIIFDCWFLLTVITFIFFENEMKILSLLIKEIDNKTMEIKNQKEFKNNNKKQLINNYELILRNDLKNLVLHHQLIIK